MSQATAMPTMEEIAAAMAGGGSITEDGIAEVDDQGQTILPQATEPAIPPETGAASAKVAEETKPATTAAPAQAEAAKTEAPPAQQQQAAAPADWREELKKQTDATEALKILGFDDKIIGLVNKWKGGGDVNEYLRAANVDYSKMSDEEVMRHQLREEYPEFSADELESLYQGLVMEKYKIDPDLFDDKQQRVGKVLVKADANKARQGLITKQQQFILDSKPPAPAGPTPQQQAEQAQNTRNWFRSEVLKSPLATSLATNKKFVIGTGDEAFNFDTDPNEIFDIVSHQEKMMEQTFDKRVENGKDLYYPNGDKMVLQGLVAKHGMALFDAFGKHMRALGAAGALEPIENANKDSHKAAAGEPEMSIAEALAKAGKMTVG